MGDGTHSVMRQTYALRYIRHQVGKGPGGPGGILPAFVWVALINQQDSAELDVAYGLAMAKIFGLAIDLDRTL